MLMGVLYTPAYIVNRYTRVYVYTRRGFLHCLFDYNGFSQDLKWRISKKEIRVFILSYLLPAQIGHKQRFAVCDL